MQIFCLQKAGMERHERLRLARERHFEKMTEAAESLGVPYGTYSGHESGSRGFKVEELILYARRFHVSRAWLAFGDGDMDDIVSSASTPRSKVETETDAASSRDDTDRPLGTTYIQVELEALRELLSGALQNESISEEQADAYADAVLLSLKERTTASLVLMLGDEAHTGAGSPMPRIAGRS